MIVEARTKCPLSPPKYALNISTSELAAHFKGRDYGSVSRNCRAAEEGKETYGLGNELKEQRTVQQIEDTP
ncbi:hypothetical protein TIFTF001_028410 [Ficus carica]|uniref:Uncharacterized protein n=1 Tax=Ficus carica TaxID=3494 RepID=A0AA88J143_FICCA|nr:hypothetical protein TIFTF001_028410 [Ficus carica]